MNGLSSATVEGYVTQDPVVKKTKNNKDLCTFSIAIRHYAGVGNEPKVSFIDIETWDKLAVFCSDAVKKGKKILVMGLLRQDRWKSNEGKDLSKILIVGNQIRVISSSGGGISSEQEQLAS